MTRKLLLSILLITGMVLAACNLSNLGNATAEPTATPALPTFTASAPTNPAPLPTYTPQLTFTPLPTYTPQPTYTALPTYTQQPTLNPRSTATRTLAPTYTPRPTYTPLPTYTPRPTYTALPTYTQQPTLTPRSTATGTLAPTYTPRSTATGTLAPTYTPQPTYTPLPTHTPLPTFTPLPTHTSLPTFTPFPTYTPLPTVTVVPVVPPPIGSDAYLDDRSNPIALISSYFNAVNRKEYMRAYSYWQDPPTQLGTLGSFTSGYSNTASVSLVFGAITVDSGAGQTYYTVPVRLKGIATNGVHGDYAACYVVHFANPSFFGAPPIVPMNIDKGTAKSVSVSAADSSVLADACSGSDFPIGDPVTITSTSSDISKNNYLDSRSDAIWTVSSYLNALNRKEYVRAYSYSQDPATQFGPYTTYAAGYTDTDVITAVFGKVVIKKSAGNNTYKVPLAMKVLSTSADLKTYVGCFNLYLANPTAQSVYPFKSIGLTGGDFKKVGNSANIDQLLVKACK